MTKPKIKIGDIVRVEDCHHAEPHYYEVSDIRGDGVVSQPADYRHRWNAITAVYRLKGNDFVMIWEGQDNE